MNKQVDKIINEIDPTILQCYDCKRYFPTKTNTLVKMSNVYCIACYFVGDDEHPYSSLEDRKIYIIKSKIITI